MNIPSSVSKLSHQNFIGDTGQRFAPGLNSRLLEG